MKSRFVCSALAALVFGGAFAQEVDKDLPTDKNAGEKLKYKWDEVLEVAPKVIEYYQELGRQNKRHGWDHVAYGESYVNWAEALMGKGLVDEARAKLDEIIAADIKWAGYYNGGRALS